MAKRLNDRRSHFVELGDLGNGGQFTAKLESVEVAQSSNPVAYSVMATYMTTRERDSVGMWFRVISFHYKQGYQQSPTTPWL